MAEYNIYRSTYTAQQIQNSIGKNPIIGSNGNWWVWNIATSAWVDTGVAPSGVAIPQSTALLKGNGTGGVSAATAGTDYAIPTQLCNPNLLDNWYFGNPVNQRGFSVTPSTSSKTYTIDRWFRRHAGKIELLSDGIKISYENNQTWFVQLLETALKQKLFGKQITMSCIVEEISGNWQLYTNGLGTASKNLSVGINSISFTSSDKGGEFDIALVSVSNAVGDYIKVSAVKLELGSTQTLAHQENGVWVLNEIPDYGEQLRRCQRYFFVMDSVYSVGISQTSNTIGFPIDIPSTMRAIPTLSYGSNGLIEYYNGTSWVVISSSTSKMVYGKTNLYIYVSSGVTTTTLQTYPAYITDVYLSADL